MIVLTFALKILLAVVILSVLIFIHELGHFLFAKWNKVAVLEFAVGFGKVVWQKKHGVTRYTLRLIPLGGYVRMAGDDYGKYYDGEDQKKSEEEQAATEGEEQEKFSIEPVSDRDLEQNIDRSQWFFEKGLLARSSIVFAGPLFNFILAWFLVFFVYLFYGASVPNNQPIIGDLIPDYPAVEAGLESGDKILNVSGKNIDSWEGLVAAIKAQKDQPVELLVERNKDNQTKRINLTLVPKAESKEMKIIGGEDPNKVEAEPRYLIGIQPSYDREPVPINQAFTNSCHYIYFTSALTVRSVWHLIVGNISAKHIGGPILIMQEAVNSAKKGFERLLMFVVFISISLGVLNLLPIPVLDGGHLFLFLLEAIKGGRLNKRFVDYANQLGLFLLLALMVFAIGNDIFRLVN